jgi:hypothetical protein
VSKRERSGGEATLEKAKNLLPLWRRCLFVAILEKAPKKEGGEKKKRTNKRKHGARHFFIPLIFGSRFIDS